LSFFKQIKRYIIFNGPDTKENRIYISERDTIYFLDVTPRYNFLKTLRVMNKAIPLNHFAFRSESIHKFYDEIYPGRLPPNRPSLLQHVVMQHPGLTHIIATFDTSHFKISREPQNYVIDALPCGGRHCHERHGKMKAAMYQKMYLDFSWKMGHETSWRDERDKRAWTRFLEKNLGWKKPECEIVHVKKR
jgi:hypothetical protein